jgi:hypothetical protein
MFVEQMPVYFADQNPAIFMPEPGCDGHKVDSCHDTNGTKVMAQVMKTDPFEAGQYFSLNLSIEELRTVIRSRDQDPLKPFGEACRRELKTMRTAV